MSILFSAFHILHLRPNATLKELSRSSRYARQTESLPRLSSSIHIYAKMPLLQKKFKKSKEIKSKDGGFDDVLVHDINQLLKTQGTRDGTSQETSDAQRPKKLPERFTEIELTISDLSSTGDGLALSANGDHVYVVPFTVPGDKVLAKVIRHHVNLSYTVTDFLRVLNSGPQRDDSRIQCKYFGKCAGCHLQMLSYDDQLRYKKRIVEKAYANFSGLLPELIPHVDDTFQSPRQYGYRTKLTPHFTIPGAMTKQGPRYNEIPPIGFTMKNSRKDIDIEECPLGTDIVNHGLKRERKRVAENLAQFKKGATLLMRESTTRIKKDKQDSMPELSSSANIKENADDSNHLFDKGPNPEEEVMCAEFPNYIEEKRCITDSNATSVEYIDNFVFYNRAGSFFQNNNSILSGFTDFIRQYVQPPTSSNSCQANNKPIKYLLDAYSGSGLFTVTLASTVKSSLGIDIAPQSIVDARMNAKENNLPNTGFAAADAAQLFKDVPYPPDHTLLVIDPPRKGCSNDFLRQVLDYGPRRVIYVSCNVHTQAPDVGFLVQGNANCRYDIESIRGFDFFPQTSHVEGVAILNKAYSAASSSGFDKNSNLQDGDVAE